MPPHDLVHGAARDILHPEPAALARDLDREHEVAEQVAELLAERLGIAPPPREPADLGHRLLALLEEVLPEVAEAPLAVPGAAPGRAESLEDGDEAVEVRAGGGHRGSVGAGEARPPF